MAMRIFLARFYDYVKSPEGFNCVAFQYEGIRYQVILQGKLRRRLEVLEKQGK